MTNLIKRIRLYFLRREALKLQKQVTDLMHEIDKVYAHCNSFPSYQLLDRADRMRSVLNNIHMRNLKGVMQQIEDLSK